MLELLGFLCDSPARMISLVAFCRKPSQKRLLGRDLQTLPFDSSAEHSAPRRNLNLPAVIGRHSGRRSVQSAVLPGFKPICVQGDKCWNRQPNAAAPPGDSMMNALNLLLTRQSVWPLLGQDNLVPPGPLRGDQNRLYRPCVPRAEIEARGYFIVTLVCRISRMDLKITPPPPTSELRCLRPAGGVNCERIDPAVLRS